MAHAPQPDRQQERHEIENYYEWPEDNGPPLPSIESNCEWILFQIKNVRADNARLHHKIWWQRANEYRDKPLSEAYILPFIYNKVLYRGLAHVPGVTLSIIGGDNENTICGPANVGASVTRRIYDVPSSESGSEPSRSRIGSGSIFGSEASLINAAQSAHTFDGIYYHHYYDHDQNTEQIGHIQQNLDDIVLIVTGTIFIMILTCFLCTIIVIIFGYWSMNRKIQRKIVVNDVESL